MAFPCADADTVHFMRAKGPIRVLVLLLAVSLLPVLTVSAHHGPTAGDVVKVAEGTPWLMSCNPASGQQVCTDPNVRVPNRRAIITPDLGPLQSVITFVNATVNSGYYMPPADEPWNVALHDVGCNDPNGVGSFISTLGADNKVQAPFTLGPVVAGECSITGSLIAPTVNGGAWYYKVTSTILSSAFPTPTPTPKPTAIPTPRPTPTATPRPTAIPTPRPTPTATPRPTATPSVRPTATATAKPTTKPTATATTTATATASESASASATATATSSPSTTPEQSVAGIVFTPEPTVAPPAPAGGGGDWAGSVPSAGDVSTNGANLAGSALAALLLLLAMGFIGELFNNTLESNYDRILAGWRKSWLGRIGKAFSGLWGGGA
jgi:hypothetical protein